MRTVLAAIAIVALASCTGGGGSAAALCNAVAQLDGVSATFQGFDPTDRDAALDQLRPARVALGDLLDKAPDSVRDDLQVEIDYVQALIDALDAAHPGDPADAARRVQTVTVSHPKVTDAAATLADFAARECTPNST